jgi:two-component system, NtrC family, nitrogen regulation sensor histidine kinase NtrY
MKLRGRFTLWFALAALVPIAAAALGTRQVLSNNYREGYERRQRTAESLARQELARLKGEVARTVESLAQRDSYYLGGLLVELEKAGGTLEQPVLGQVLGRLREQGTPLMKALGLDLMMVLDGRAEVLFSPHYRPAQHETDPSRPARAAESGGAPYFAREPIIRGDRIGQELVVEAARTASRGRHRATVVGGRIIDREVLAALRQDQAVTARVVDGEGAVLVALAGQWVEEGAGPAIRLPLEGPGGAPVAWIEMAVSQAELETVLRQVTLLSAGLGGAALLLTVLLGSWVAARMTRDLDELVVGAQAASRGDLDHQVPVRTRDEIGAVAEAFNTMMVDLKDSKEQLALAERVAAWQEIARRLAHEIKNPLTPIQMSVETLRKTWAVKHPSFDEIFEESTQTVLEEAGRLKRIVSEFSEFARLPKPERGPVDLNELVSGTLSLYQGSIEIERALAPGLPAIEADRDQLSQVLLNLVENARDAGAAAGTVTVRIETRLSRPGRAVALVVEDAGPGIPTAVRDRIFTPYFTTKHASGGTGLGLAIVHRIVTDHGGRIAVSVSDLGGARFLIELPLVGAGLDPLASRG